MKKQSISFLLLVAVIGIVGLTVAYFSSTTTFENEFQTPEYGTTYIEKFTSPDNWLPGDETEKTLEVRNSGNVDEAVRVKVEESWVSKRGTTLPLTQGDNVVAQINFINGNDWTKVEVDGANYYYYYYNYKLAPGETTSKLLDKVTFNSAITSSATCSDTIVDGTTTRTCNSNETGYDGATYNLKLTIETVQYNKYQDAWNTSINIAASKPELEPELEPTQTGVEYLAENATNPSTITSYNDESADKNKMFQFNHTVNNEIITESRYIGDVPNNYIYFNCDSLDNQNSDTCEVWRILGIFDVERTVEDAENPGQNIIITEQRMKLVRGNDLKSTMAWDSSNVNNWTTASLNTYLNGDYYIDLSENAQLQIDDAIYYLGGFVWNNTTPISTEQIYEFERGSTVYNGRPTSWEGRIALMYPSDMYMTYAYGVFDSCYLAPMRSGCGGNPTKSWIYNTNLLQNDSDYQKTWFLSHRSDVSSPVFYADRATMDRDKAQISNGVRPVVYLSADVKIIDGDGSSDNPYKLKM